MLQVWKELPAPASLLASALAASGLVAAPVPAPAPAPASASAPSTEDQERAAGHFFENFGLSADGGDKWLSEGEAARSSRSFGKIRQQLAIIS